jgi:hypothetical protein
LLDSVFAFTDLPVRLLSVCGLLGLVLGVSFGITVGFLRLVGEIDVPGYAATIVVITFFGSLNTLGLGIVGIYAWRANENAKRRPLAVVQAVDLFEDIPPAPNKGAT